jgi:hypothetical protein
MAQIMSHQMIEWTQNRELKGCGWKWLWFNLRYCHGIYLDRHVQNRRKVCLQAKICSWTPWIRSRNGNQMITMCASVLFTVVSLTGIYAWAWSIILQVGLWPCKCFILKKCLNWGYACPIGLFYLLLNLLIPSLIHLYIVVIKLSPCRGCSILSSG